MSIICERQAGKRRQAPQSRPRPAGLSTLGWFLACMGMTCAQINQFEGGHLSLQIEGNWSPFGFASNTGARGSMSAVTTLFPTASAWFGNPAALGGLQGAEVQTDFFLPGLGLGVSSERTKLLRQNLRAPLHDFLNSGDHHVEEPVYPDIDMSLYQSTNVSGVNLAWGNGRFAFGAGVQQPFRGWVDAAASGWQLGLALPEEEGSSAGSASPTPPGAAGDSLRVVLGGDAFARLRAELDDFALGLSAAPRRNVKVGISYHRFIAQVDVDAQARLDGVIRRGDQTFSYQDPTAAYRDDLGAKGRGEVEGEASGFRIGAAWDIWRTLGLDITASFAETMRLRGQVNSVYHLLPIFNPASDTQFSFERYNPAKPTLTQAFRTGLDSVQITLPWDISASVRAAFGPVRVHFDYTYFLRNLGVAFTVADTSDVFDPVTRDVAQKAKGGDSLDISRVRQNFGLALRQQFALGLQIDQVWLHLGILDYRFEQRFIDETAAWKPSFLPFVPTLNLGYFFPIGPRFTTTVSLLAFPVALFKTSIEYRY